MLPTADPDGLIAGPPVHLGPRAYRRRLRTLGPLVALAVPAACGLLALAALHGSTSSARGVTGFVLAVLAAPGLLVAGAPLAGSAGTYTVAALASAVGWALLGVLAARRATRRPVASWREFWAEFVWLLAGVWAGVVIGIVAVLAVVGTGLL